MEQPRCSIPGNKVLALATLSNQAILTPTPTTATDLLLGLLKRLIIERKDDLKVIIMSATIDAIFFRKISRVPWLKRSKVESTGCSRVIWPNRPRMESQPSWRPFCRSIRLGSIAISWSSCRASMRCRRSSRCSKRLSVGEKALFGAHEIGPLVSRPLHATLSEIAQEEAVDGVAPGPRDGKFGRKLLVVSTFEIQALETLSNQAILTPRFI